MFGFSCFSVKNYINVIYIFNAFTWHCFKYIVETCWMILNEYNKDIIFESIPKIL
jgi:hypothetical protein